MNELNVRASLNRAPSQLRIMGRTNDGGIFSSTWPSDIFPREFAHVRSLEKLVIAGNVKMDIDPFVEGLYSPEQDPSVVVPLFTLIQDLKLIKIQSAFGSGRNLGRFLLWVLPRLTHLESLSIGLNKLIGSDNVLEGIRSASQLRNLTIYMNVDVIGDTPATSLGVPHTLGAFKFTKAEIDSAWEPADTNVEGGPYLVNSSIVEGCRLNEDFLRLLNNTRTSSESLRLCRHS